MKHKAIAILALAAAALGACGSEAPQPVEENVGNAIDVGTDDMNASADVNAVDTDVLDMNASDAVGASPSDSDVTVDQLPPKKPNKQRRR